MQRFIKISTISCLLASSIMLSNTAYADDTAIIQQLKQMQQQIELLSNKVENQQLFIENQQAYLTAQGAKLEEYSSLQGEIIDERIAGEFSKITPAGGSPSSRDNFIVEFKPAPRISSTDGRFSFQPFGRLQLDYTFFNDDVTDNADNVNLRRARLGFQGKVYSDWEYKFEMDFATESLAIKSAYITYNGLDDVTLMAGNHKPYLTLNDLTSSKYIQFIERSAPSGAFGSSELLGISALTNGDNWSFATGVFNDDAGEDSADDEAWSLAARGTFAPIMENRKILHLGLSANYRVPNADADSIRLRARPETSKGLRYVDTGTISNVDSTTTISLEAATIIDSLSIQGEYMKMNVSLDTASSDPSFDGWYVQTSYFLTGESRPYSPKSGKFGRLKPSNPFGLGRENATGAWEIAARYSNTNLTDANAGIFGGEMSNWTAGINWYINNNTRLMANYINIDTDGNAAVANENPQLFIVRAAMDF